MSFKVLVSNCAGIGVSVNSENPNPTMQLRWSVDTWLAPFEREFDMNVPCLGGYLTISKVVDQQFRAMFC